MTIQSKVKRAGHLVSRIVPRNIRESVALSSGYAHSTESPTACHLNYLFVQHSGYVYPCCLKWADAGMRIGHLNDPDIIEKILAYERKCWCSIFHAKLAKAAPTDRVRRINIEVSLACNGDCAMCCVLAPEWKGTYDYYEHLDRLLDALRPDEIHVQGGEVLVQRKTLNWLEGLKRRHPGMSITSATNGNVDLDTIEMVERIFSKLCVSIAGFQPFTYKTIMGLDFERMDRFVTELIRRGRVAVQLKFMLGPLNLHESGAFVDWASTIGPQEIAFGETGTIRHIRLDAPFDFWNKIIQRSTKNLQDALIRNRDQLRKNSTLVYLEPTAHGLLCLHTDWVEANGLADIVRLQ